MMKKTLLFLIAIGILSCLNACGGGTSSSSGGVPSGPATYTFSVLYTFTGVPDGSAPRSDLILDQSGNLYGTTRNGGVSDFGTVFKLDTSGHEAVLHSFATGEGAAPFGGLVRDSAGNLYGTTFGGGDAGYGTVYKLDSTGKLTVLHSFETGPLDGGQPLAGLVMDAAGNLYGTASFGGADGGGVVFKVDGAGEETVMHDFAEDPAGFFPSSSLILDAAGNLYGTNVYGGGALCECGAVFKVDPSGNDTKLYAFVGKASSDGPYGPDADTPLAGVVRDKAGTLYGTTVYGGSADMGTVYRVESDGTELAFHSFTGDDGEWPEGSLVLDAAGYLYGTTAVGGTAGGGGTVFVLDPAGKLTVLHSFNGQDGWNPLYAVVRDKAGNIYGTTTFGGSGNCGCGTVFKLTRQ